MSNESMEVEYEVALKYKYTIELNLAYSMTYYDYMSCDKVS